MATACLQSPRRRNVSPTTSILHTFVEDCDCSGTDHAKTPEDGQIITVAGKVGYNNFGSTYAHAAVASVTQEGHMLRMVWGSAQRSDRSALGQKRVPVFKKGAIRVKTKFFYVADDTKVPSNSANKWYPGAMVSVIQVPNDEDNAALQGTNNRLCPAPLDIVLAAASGTNAWCIGSVERVTNDIVGNGAEVEIFLWETPRLITEGNADATIAAAATTL